MKKPLSRYSEGILSVKYMYAMSRQKRIASFHTFLNIARHVKDNV